MDKKKKTEHLPIKKRGENVELKHVKIKIERLQKRLAQKFKWNQKGKKIFL